MNGLIIPTTIPGKDKANKIMAALSRSGIRDVQLFYDKDLVPKGMWAVVQVQRNTSSLILPESYTKDNIRPYILWWCKTNTGHYRDPNDEDLYNIVAVVTNARIGFKEDPHGEQLADRLDEQSKEKDRKHNENFKKKIHEIAPAMKRALRTGNL